MSRCKTGAYPAGQPLRDAAADPAPSPLPWRLEPTAAAGPVHPRTGIAAVSALRPRPRRRRHGRTVAHRRDRQRPARRGCGRSWRGWSNPGNEPEDVARRELVEEIGLEALDLIPVRGLLLQRGQPRRVRPHVLRPRRRRPGCRQRWAGPRERGHSDPHLPACPSSVATWLKVGSIRQLPWSRSSGSVSIWTRYARAGPTVISGDLPGPWGHR